MRNIDWRSIFEKSEFWAVQIAKQAIARAREKNKKIITVRCANTPTGVLHIGNANDVIRAYFVAKSVEVLGYNVRLVFTSDDRDPIRGFPKTIADKEGNLVEFKEKEEFESKYDGFPVFAIPDPFRCHSSWSEHFISVYFKELERLGIITSIRFEYYSPNVLYHSGQWLDLVKKALDQKDKINEIYKEFKQHIREYPFAVICQNCGRIGTTHVTDYDPKTGRVKYICGSRHLKKKTVEGCGYAGETTIRFGKLDWYVEWAMDWAFFSTDVEPIGKDHYSSSWRISPKIAREIFGIEEPIPVVYEFFTVDGKKMSGSKGNVYNLTFFMKILENEVLLYHLYTRKPNVHREISLRNIHLAVNEFDEFENELWQQIDSGKITDYTGLSVYYLVFAGNPPTKKPIRVPYTFAAVIGQILLPRELLINTHIPLRELGISLKEERVQLALQKIKEVLVRTGHIPKDIEEIEFYSIIDRVRKATYWAINYGPENYRIKISEKKEDMHLSEEEKELVKEIISIVENLGETINIDDLQTKIHSIIKEKTNPKQFYKKLYKMFLGKESGPKIASLISVIGKEKAKEILSRYL